MLNPMFLHVEVVSDELTFEWKCICKIKCNTSICIPTALLTVFHIVRTGLFPFLLHVPHLCALIGYFYESTVLHSICMIGTAWSM